MLINFVEKKIEQVPKQFVHRNCFDSPQFCPANHKHDSFNCPLSSAKNSLNLFGSKTLTGWVIHVCGGTVLNMLQRMFWPGIFHIVVFCVWLKYFGHNSSLKMQDNRGQAWMVIICDWLNVQAHVWFKSWFLNNLHTKIWSLKMNVSKI